MSSEADAGRVVETGHARFTFQERGNGTPLVLLHGIGSAACSWRHQLSGLSHSFRVIAWDAPGYGGSSGLLADKPDASDYALALRLFLEAIGVGSFHLLGHSFGCVTAVRYARLFPERILSLTLASIANGQGGLSEEERAKRRASRLDDLLALGPRAMAEKRGPHLVRPNTDEAVRRAVIETMAKVRPDGYAQAVWMLSTANTREDARQLPQRIRLQIVYGAQDAVTTPDENQKTARECPSAPVHVVPDAGHALYLEQPEAFNNIVLSFARASG